MFNSAEIIYNYFEKILLDKKQEYFYVIYVDTKGNYIDKKCLFVGTINSSIVHPRGVVDGNHQILFSPDPFSDGVFVRNGGAILIQILNQVVQLPFLRRNDRFLFIDASEKNAPERIIDA